MANPHVYEVGRAEDIDGMAPIVGVDYDTVTIGGHRFALEQLWKLVGLLAQAAQLAGKRDQSEVL